MTRSKQSSAPAIFQLKLTLSNSTPAIWRRMLVSSDTSLEKLHKILQVVMGWADSHLHQFIAHGQCYGIPELDFDPEMINEKKVKLGQIAHEKASFIYEYDFGDSWEHEILVEKVLSVEKEKQYPICIKGERACPPEDCGGVWGYAEFLTTINNPRDPDHQGMLEWAGGSFDPEAFDIDGVNRRLGRYSKRSRT